MPYHQLRIELKVLERKRTELRCKLADAELEVYHPERTQQRNARRLLESQRGVLIPPGVWDEDLDRYPGPEYTEDLGDGYIVTLKRNHVWSWNAYITLPDGHPSIGEHYDLFQGYVTSSIPHCPLELTYSSGPTFGIDHQHLRDTTPLYRASYSTENHYSGESKGTLPYMTYAMVLEECRTLKEYFEEIKGMADPSPHTATITVPEHQDNPDGPVEEPPSPTYMTAEQIDAPPKTWASIVRGKKLMLKNNPIELTAKDGTHL